MTNEGPRRGEGPSKVLHGSSEVRGENEEVVQLLKELLVEARALRQDSKKHTDALEMLQAMAEAT